MMIGKTVFLGRNNNNNHFRFNFFRRLIFCLFEWWMIEGGIPENVGFFFFVRDCRRIRRRGALFVRLIFLPLLNFFRQKTLFFKRGTGLFFVFLLLGGVYILGKWYIWFYVHLFLQVRTRLNDERVHFVSFDLIRLRTKKLFWCWSLK